MPQDKFENLIKALKETFIEKDRDISEISSFKFNGDMPGQGLHWIGGGYTKQFVLQKNPDKFFLSENIDLGKGKNLSIAGTKILDSEELGATVTRSNIRELGRLKGLIVDGSMIVNDFIFYDHNNDRLGLGTDSPNASLSIADNGVEILIGSSEYNKSTIGNFTSSDLEIITDNTSRISIKANGDIELGNKNFGDTSVKVNGRLGIGVNNIDPRAALHVNGSIRFNDKLHLSGRVPPEGGAFNIGDIMWNSEPIPGRCIGWVCTKAGNPGVWNSFGIIN